MTFALYTDIPGYVRVQREATGETVATAAVELSAGGERVVRHLEFMRYEDQKCNRTRQAVCKLLQREGYR